MQPGFTFGKRGSDRMFPWRHDRPETCDDGAGAGACACHAEFAAGADGRTPGRASAVHGAIAGAMPEVTHPGLLKRLEVFGRMLPDFLERIAAGEASAARRRAEG